MDSIYDKKVRIGDNILQFLIYLSAFLSVAVLVSIIGLVFIKGLPALSLNFLITTPSTITGNFGILGNIVNTLYIIVITYPSIFSSLIPNAESLHNRPI